jgi:hypothetical protein
MEDKPTDELALAGIRELRRNACGKCCEGVVTVFSDTVFADTVFGPISANLRDLRARFNTSILAQRMPDNCASAPPRFRPFVGFPSHDAHGNRVVSGLVSGFVRCRRAQAAVNTGMNCTLSPARIAHSGRGVSPVEPA